MFGLIIAAGVILPKYDLLYVTPVGSVDAVDSYSQISIASYELDVGAVYATLYPLFAAVTVIVGVGKSSTYVGTVPAQIVLLILLSGSPDKTHIAVILVLNVPNVRELIAFVMVID